jgi:hypothetical protein
MRLCRNLRVRMMPANTSKRKRCDPCRSWFILRYIRSCIGSSPAPGLKQAVCEKMIKYICTSHRADLLAALTNMTSQGT